MNFIILFLTFCVAILFGYIAYKIKKYTFHRESFALDIAATIIRFTCMILFLWLMTYYFDDSAILLIALFVSCYTATFISCLIKKQW